LSFIKTIDWLKGYNRQTFTQDLTAGFIVGIVALPLCIAMAIASGVSPEKGIITGVVAGLVVAMFSGSRVQIAGPSGPFVVLAFGIVQTVGFDGLLIATFTAGVILIIMGRVGLGSLIKFIPYPVTAGFTGGIALLLITSEVKDFFGLACKDAGGSIVDKWGVFIGAMNTVNPWAVAIALGTVILMLAQTRFMRRVPGSLVALIAATVVVQVFGLPVETIGSRFKDISSGFPLPGIPHLSFDAIHDMVQPSFAIALLAAIEALLSAVVADGMIGTTHQPNKVLIAQGLANIGSAFFGGLPATSALARTATNVRNGARTPVGGIVHSLSLLLIMLFFGHWASQIPLACLAAILVVVAYNMLDARTLKSLMHNPKSDVAVLLTTLAITVLVDLTTGIEVGMLLAAALFIKRMAGVTGVNVFTRELDREGQPRVAAAGPAVPRGVDIYEINGPFFFGAVYKLKEALAYTTTSRHTKVRMIRMANVSTMDSTGLHALEEVYLMSRKKGIAFLISEIHAQPFTALMKSGLLEKFGEENVLASFDDAIARAQEIVGEKRTTPAA
jgi:sulfate permease, SulP family